MSILNDSWRFAPKNLTLESGEVHIWLASLRQPQFLIPRLSSCLSIEEFNRANRFHFYKDRKKYIVGRGLLRQIISTYSSLNPGQIRFGYNDFGKPFLENQAGHHKLNFNLAHSHNLVLYGFVYDREIGVDIEYIREDLSNEKIAERFFSPGEVFVLRSLPKRQRQRAFFNCWTRKEAYIKAHGQGLSLPLDQFEVSLAPGQTAALLQNYKNREEPNRWSMHELSPGSGYAAALVVEGRDLNLKCWQFDQWDDFAEI